MGKDVKKGSVCFIFRPNFHFILGERVLGKNLRALLVVLVK